MQFQRSPAGAGSWTNVGSADTTSPYSVSFDTTTVSDGLYDFRAVATDGAGNTANSATISNRRIDNTAPSSTTTFPSSSGSYNTSGWNAGCGTNGFCGTYSDSGSGVQKVEISIRRASGNYWSAGSFSSGSEVWNTTSLSAGNWSYTFPASNFPADDTYTIRVRATDNVNRSRRRRTAARSRTTRPRRIRRSPRTRPIRRRRRAQASRSRRPRVARRSSASSTVAATPAARARIATLARSPTEATRSLARATDAAGNTDATAASFTWTVDTAAPSSTTSFPSSGGTYNTSGWNVGCATNGFCGTYSDATSGRAEGGDLHPPGHGQLLERGLLQLGSEVWNTTTLAGGNWSYTFPASNFPADGSYTIRVKATDNAGNVETPSSRSFTIDRAAPDTTRSRPTRPTPRTRRARASRSRSTEGGSTFECQIDGGGYSVVHEPEELLGPRQGSHTFLVRATDGAGNTDGSAASYTWTVDSVAPSSTTSFPASAGVYNDIRLERGLRHDRLLRHVLGRDLGRRRPSRSPSARATGNYWSPAPSSRASEVWNTTSLSGRELVVRVLGGELPGRRELHDPRARDRQRRRTSRHRRAGPSLSTRRTRARSSPSLPRAPATRTRPGTQAARRTASAAHTPMRPPASRRSRSPSARARATTGTAPHSGAASEAFQTASPSRRELDYTFAASNFPADGQYTIHVRAKDNALNTESGPEQELPDRQRRTRARSSPSPPPAETTTAPAGTQAA